MCKAIDLLDICLTYTVGPMPTPTAFQPVRDYLKARKIDSAVSRDVLADIAVWGSVECADYLDESDRRAIEALLPLAPYAAWAAYDDHVYALGREA